MKWVEIKNENDLPEMGTRSLVVIRDDPSERMLRARLCEGKGFGCKAAVWVIENTPGIAVFYSWNRVSHFLEDFRMPTGQAKRALKGK